MGNYAPTPFSRIADESQDVTADHDVSDVSLNQFWAIDAKKDALQEAAYRRNLAIATHHPDPATRAYMKETAKLFAQAEELESDSEDNVAKSHLALDKAQKHNRTITQIAEEHRRES